MQDQYSMESELTEFIVTDDFDEPAIFLSTQLDVSIVGWKKVAGGLFQSDYILYDLQSKGLKSKVERRYDEFIWLRDKFLRKMPYLIVPYLPTRKRKEKFTEENAQKTIKLLIVIFIIRGSLIQWLICLNSKCKDCLRIS